MFNSMNNLAEVEKTLFQVNRKSVMHINNGDDFLKLKCDMSYLSFNLFLHLFLISHLLFSESLRAFKPAEFP